MTIKPQILATNPTLDGIKSSIARYWHTTPDHIDIEGEKVLQDGHDMEDNAVLSHKGGFKFVDLRGAL